MSGKVKGAAVIFCSETGNDKAVYFRCASHELNLCLSKSSKVPRIYNTISTMQALAIFFKYSPNRQRKLEASIADVTDKENLESTIKAFCETWWVERYTAFEYLFILHDPVLHRLESIQNNVDPENRFDPKFIVSFYTCYHLFGYTKCLSKTAYEMVSLVTEPLSDIYSNQVNELKEIFKKWETMANLSIVALTVPRIV